jgi:AcrR family transcriptional regulator
MQILASVFSAAKYVLRATAKGAVWVLEAPIQLLGGMLGGGGGSHEPDERDVAMQAAQRAQAEQRQADSRAQIDAQAQCVLRIARSLRDGGKPDPRDAAALSPAHVHYLLGLSRGELEIVAAASMNGIRSRRAFASSLTPPDGCRSVDEVLQALDNKAVSPGEHRFRTLADKIRARRQGTEKNGDVCDTVRKYTQAA